MRQTILISLLITNRLHIRYQIKIGELKRWEAFMEEFSPKFHYKQLKENVFAVKLSRQHINSLDLKNMSYSDAETIHIKETFTEVISTVTYPVNSFINQIVLETQKLQKFGLNHESGTDLLRDLSVLVKFVHIRNLATDIFIRIIKKKFFMQSIIELIRLLEKI